MAQYNPKDNYYSSDLESTISINFNEENSLFNNVEPIDFSELIQEWCPRCDKMNYHRLNYDNLCIKCGFPKLKSIEEKNEDDGWFD